MGTREDKLVLRSFTVSASWQYDYQNFEGSLFI